MGDAKMTDTGSETSPSRDLLGPESLDASWLNDGTHRAWLLADARRQLQFFQRSLKPDGGFDVLDVDGQPIAGVPQELHTTARLVHSYAL